MIRYKNIIVVCIGVCVGLVNGFFGAGAGSLLVPALVHILKIDEKQAHATAILIILPISIASSIIYITKIGVDLNLFIILGVLIGGVMGALLLKRLKSDVINKIFCVLMLASGVSLLCF